MSDYWHKQSPFVTIVFNEDWPWGYGYGLPCEVIDSQRRMNAIVEAVSEVMLFPIKRCTALVKEGPKSLMRIR